MIYATEIPDEERKVAPPLEIAKHPLTGPSGVKEMPIMPKEFLSIIESQGEPFVLNRKNIALNPMFIPALYAKRNQVLFDGATRRFHEYNPETGLWTITSPESIRQRISDLTLEVGRTLGREPTVLMERTNSKLDGASKNLAALVDGGFTDRPSGFVHCTNGMLDVRSGELHPFSPDFKSRNATPFAWDENAVCPVFASELLASALTPEDIEIIQLYAGMALMGRNLAQRILMLTGTAGGGKSTLCTVIEGLIGVLNCTEARTKHLAERFELARFVGKTLLTGKDVRGDFLMTEGAYVLKALSGGDRLETEIKNGMSSHQIVGDFSIIITCNTRLRVRLDGDTDAWRRRLIKIDYERPKPANPVPDFANLLLTKEGSGILKWAVDGAKKLLELEYDFPITPAQQARVDSLLYESDALRSFVGSQIEKSAGGTLTTSEIVEAFFAFCDERGWATSSVAQVEKDLPNAMMEIHRAAKSSSIERQGKSAKGFRGVRLAGTAHGGTDGTAVSNPNACEETLELSAV
jgi:putative DNA primase/helicase